MRKGSLTVFFALVMVFVITLVFALGECTRSFAYQNLSEIYLENALESAFSEYNRYVWENYKLLAVDLAYGSKTEGPSVMEGRIVEYALSNASPEAGMSLLRLEPMNCKIDEYLLLTDNNGMPLIQEGIQSAKDELLISVIDEIESNNDKINTVEAVDVASQVSDGQNSISNAIAAKREADEEVELPQVEDDPLDAFSKFNSAMSQGVLSMVIPDGKSYQSNSISKDKMPSHRQLQSGNIMQEESVSPLDKVLFGQYLIKTYSRYGGSITHDGLNNELEYLIAGKENDKDNLAAVVERLLIMREAANIATIMSNESLHSQARALAAALSVVAEGIYPIVEAAVIAAWAYVESVLDVRAILNNKRISIIKSSQEWTSDVFHLSGFMDINVTAKECTSGLNYEDYLRAFLAVVPAKTLAMRACDVIENSLNMQEGYESVRVDNMLVAANAEINYSGKQLFLSAIPGEYGQDNYSIKREKYMSY